MPVITGRIADSDRDSAITDSDSNYDRTRELQTRSESLAASLLSRHSDCVFKIEV